MPDKSVIFRIIPIIKPYRNRLIVAMVSMVAVASLSALQAYMVKPLLDEIFFKKDRLMLNLLPLALMLLFLVKGVFYYCYSYFMERVGQGVILDLRKKIYDHIQNLPLSFFSKTPTGELISRIISDVTLMQGAVSSALVGTLKDLFQALGLLTVLFYQDWKLALMSLVFLPLASLPIYRFGKKFRELSFSSQSTIASIANILQETIQGNRIVKAFGMETYEYKRFSERAGKLFRITMKDVQLKSLNHPLMELLGGIGIALIMWYGGNQVLNGHSTPGTFFSFLTALIMVYEPIKNISKVNNPIQHGLAAATRVFNILDIKPEIADKPGAVELPPVRTEIVFNDVHFSYDGTTEILKGINLTVTPGEVIALVGTSGGGKTTLANLIPRFLDVTTGKISIDGHDIRDVTMKSLRSQIAIVTQQTILFNDTVRNNIAYGDLEKSEEELVAVARAAHALDFINELPEGFETIIGESGARLSGGQQQRISIARALAKDAPILILDEATSALDTESEREVQKALENLMRGRTTFIIAHRLSTIKNADRIIVIKDGLIAEEGAHDTLLAKNGVYHMLYTMQFVEQ
ncbi:MAG: lipid A export permease/ATP-binding protein MsbA [Desulfurivibrionaceae bacterium]|jgi:subfamily B ATP-binding cassette protein MsbA|nr:lipid A export permease/ATP-binding protein MsbA [Pseudomonadota bacterium]MCG2823381.1 lipid A export permease/ATP-binding protein MsbA [Desulfobulbaceae bacterium]MDP2001462.1 lipid A export permease/ATP-binding protein MsbA [Desulfurivibrionaceae bacterium]MBU4230056.1 lipid A export permease/ATP-binding protein MsbA [Pseudomonadota bacterium]MBU4411701.1 lipid A export permease/ATP-binding protein MsbA [Pseudomonadota bacterium]